MSTAHLLGIAALVVLAALTAVRLWPYAVAALRLFVAVATDGQRRPPLQEALVLATLAILLLLGAVDYLLVPKEENR